MDRLDLLNQFQAKMLQKFQLSTDTFKTFHAVKGVHVTSFKIWQTSKLSKLYIYHSMNIYAMLPDLGSMPGRVIPETQKMVFDASLLNTQHYQK